MKRSRYREEHLRVQNHADVRKPETRDEEQLRYILDTSDPKRRVIRAPKPEDRR